MTTKSNDPVMNLVSPAISNIVALEATLNNANIGLTVPGPAQFTNITLPNLTNYSLLAASGVSPVVGIGPGTTGYPLLSNGAAAYPSFQKLDLTGPGVLIPTRTPVFASAYNVYVSPTGSDTLNTGLSPTSPFQTIQHAWNFIQVTVDIRVPNTSINIFVADGTYTQGLQANSRTNGSPLYFVNVIGNVGNPASCSVSDPVVCFASEFGAQLYVEGFTITSVGSGASSGLSAYAGTLQFNAINFSTCQGAHILLQAGSSMLCQNTTSYFISGDSPYHINAGAGSNIAYGNVTVDLIGTRTFSSVFCAVSDGAIVENASAVTFTGAAVGKTYSANNNGIINTNGGGPNFYPGNIPGTTSNNGLYL